MGSNPTMDCWRVGCGRRKRCHPRAPRPDTVPKTSGFTEITSGVNTP
jgi:hypothetical protein